MISNFRLFLVTLAMLLCAGYVSIYLYYRLIDDGAVLNYTGAFAWSVGESFASESVVSLLSHSTGTEIAPTVNACFKPVMRLDAFLTGHHIRFTDHIAKPIFPPGSLQGLEPIIVDFSVDDSEKIESFIREWRVTDLYQQSLR